MEAAARVDASARVSAAAAAVSRAVGDVGATDASGSVPSAGAEAADAGALSEERGRSAERAAAAASAERRLSSERAAAAASLRIAPPPPVATFIDPAAVNFAVHWTELGPLDPVYNSRAIPIRHSVPPALFLRHGSYLTSDQPYGVTRWIRCPRRDGDAPDQLRVAVWGFHEDCPSRMVLWPLLLSNDLQIIEASRFDTEHQWLATSDRRIIQLFGGCKQFYTRVPTDLRDPSGLVGDWFTPTMY
jgi:hypothetical protein